MKVELPPKVVFTKEAYFRMMQYCRLTETEVTGFGTVAEEGNTLVVREIFIVPQVATHAGVQVDGKALLDFMKWAREQGREDLITTSKLWWHSHASFDVFRSGTDNATIEMLLGMQPYVLAVVGNHKSEYECSLHYQRPRVSFTDLRIIQEDFNRDAVMDEIRQDIKDMVQKWKRPPEPPPKLPDPMAWPVHKPADAAVQAFSGDEYSDSKLFEFNDTDERPVGKGSIYSMTDDEYRRWLQEQFPDQGI